MKVKELVEKLLKFDQEKEVFVDIPDGRQGEYASINYAKKDNLKNQNTDGDPEEWGNKVIVLIGH